MPSRLTDDLWLAAHDSVNGKPTIGDWPLGVGLATGLLAELVHGRFLELREGELFRTGAALPDDPALRPLLVTMETEERNWPPPQPGPSTQAWAHARAQIQHTHAWTQSPQHGWRPLPVSEEEQRRRGHELGTWMSYLAYERAEGRVIDRLARAGLVKREQRRRLFRNPTVRYVPYDSVVAGTPANTINTAMQRGLKLSTSELFFAGLLLATGLHLHALATLTPAEHFLLSQRLKQGLDPMSRELLRAAHAAVGDAAMR
jgi:Golgi phosphoprotein 3 (GPP34)